MKLNIVRWTCLIILGILTFLLGLIRYDYVINLIDSSLPMLLPRSYAERTAYPLSVIETWESFKTDPRWTSNIIYFSYPMLSTISAIYLLFNKRSYIQLTLLFYGIGLLLLVVMITIGVLLNNYTLGYGIAQHLKKIYQEPYVSLLLLGGFYWDQQKRKKEVR